MVGICTPILLSTLCLKNLHNFSSVASDPMLQEIHCGCVQSNHQSKEEDNLFY
ncbi:unnamed protein product [Arabidopsis thaliana]|uniref:(thale cress) hypothetical protein n=1 Tax=Arabidopsis thaliana TaxID=3702 RepID=A0A7G2E061_ARATH|nr:unnamed protein product [Arabidopsis thaliana]